MRFATGISSALGLLLCAATLYAQSGIAATTTPDPATGGGTITLTVTPRLPINLPSASAYATVRMGTPTGPIVPGCCISMPVIVSLAPCQSYSTTWIAPNVIQPAVFYFEVQYYTAAWNLVSEFFPVSVDPAGPVLYEFFPAQQGAWWQLALGLTGSGSVPFVACASFTTNTGITAPSIGFIALDNDPLFQLTLANALPGYSFGLQGMLDTSGASPPIGLFIPAGLGLACQSLHMQAAVLLPNGSLALSQCHDTWIL